MPVTLKTVLLLSASNVSGLCILGAVYFIFLA